MNAPPVPKDHDGADALGRSAANPITLGEVERDCLDAITGRWCAVMDVDAAIGNLNRRTHGGTCQPQSNTSA